MLLKESILSELLANGFECAYFELDDRLVSTTSSKDSNIDIIWVQSKILSTASVENMCKIHR